MWFAFTENEADATVRTLIEAKQQSDKPFVVSRVGVPEHALKKLQEAGISCLRGCGGTLRPPRLHVRPTRRWPPRPVAATRSR